MGNEYLSHALKESEQKFVGFNNNYPNLPDYKEQL